MVTIRADVNGTQPRDRQNLRPVVVCCPVTAASHNYGQVGQRQRPRRGNDRPNTMDTLHNREGLAKDGLRGRAVAHVQHNDLYNTLNS